jgi:hypothetical protein
MSQRLSCRLAETQLRVETPTCNLSVITWCEQKSCDIDVLLAKCSQSRVAKMRLRRKLRARLHVRALLLITAGMCVGALSSDTRADAAPNYSVDFYSINSGGTTVANNCYRLSGTVGQAAPGYSAGNIYALIAGYWQEASVTVSDAIFFNGFEEC